MIKVLDCPFCGEQANLTQAGGPYGIYGFVECDLCGARSKTKKIVPATRFENEDDFWSQDAFQTVAKYWNRRKGVK